MKLKFKICIFLFFALTGFLFSQINSVWAGTCTCCYVESGETSDITGCTALCREYGGWRSWREGTTPTINPVTCSPPVGSCACCWAAAPEPGEMTLPACTTACTSKGAIKSFRSEVTYLNISRDCIPPPDEEMTGGTGEEAESEESPSGGGVLSGGLQKAAGQAGFQSTPIEEIISNIIYVVLGFVGVIFLGLILFAGFTWMMARGNTEDVERAKKMIERALIGIVIVFAAYAITYFVTSRLLGETSTSGGGSSCETGEIDCTTICTGGTYPRDLCVPSTESCICE